MAMLKMDSFDRYTTNAQVTERFDSVVSTPVIVAGVGRSGAALRLRHDGGTFGGAAARVLTAVPSLGTVIQAGAYKAHTIAADCVIAYLVDNSTEQLRLVLRSDKLLEVRRGSTVIGTAGTKVISSTSWQHIAWKVAIHDTTGQVEVRVNNIVDIVTAANQNTRVSTNNFCTLVGLGDNAVINIGLGNTADEYWDDYYICDTSGGENNDFPGDLRIEAVSVDGNGYQNDGTPSAGSAYQCVDETTPNSDTDYVEMVSGDIQAYTCANLTAVSATIKAVSVNSYSKKVEAGTRTVRHLVRKSGANTNGAVFSPSTDYDFTQTIFEGVLTSVAEVNAMEIGVEIIS